MTENMYTTTGYKLMVAVAAVETTREGVADE